MTLSSHATLRSGQRRVSLEDVDLALDYGTRIHNAGAVFCFVRKKDLPGDLSAGQAGRLEGLTLILDPDENSIITLYKNPAGLREIKRKHKRYVGDHRRPAMAA